MGEGSRQGVLGPVAQILVADEVDRSPQGRIARLLVEDEAIEHRPVARPAAHLLARGPQALDLLGKIVDIYLGKA